MADKVIASRESAANFSLRRILGLGGIAFAFYNTLSQVSDIAASISSTRETLGGVGEPGGLSADSIGIADFTYSNNFKGSYWSIGEFVPVSDALIQSSHIKMLGVCYEGAYAVTIYCGFRASPVYAALITVWSIFFSALLLFHAAVDYKYWSNDFRILLHREIVNSSIQNRILCYSGSLLTIICAIIGVVELYKSYVSNENAVLSKLVSFTVINLTLFASLMSRRYPSAKIDMEKFPEPIWFNYPSIISTSDEVFKILELELFNRAQSSKISNGNEAHNAILLANKEIEDDVLKGTSL